jgi:hypothetical protein
MDLLPPGQGSNTATQIELRDGAGKILKSLLLGKKHLQKSSRPSPFGESDEGGWPDGRYVMADPKSGKVALVSDAMTDLEPQAEHWINKDFFRVENARSLEVDYPEATNSWRLTRESESGPWALADARAGERLDPGKLSAMSNPLAAPTFNDVSIGSSPAQTGLDRPTTIKIGTSDGFAYRISIGAKTNDTYFMTVGVNGDLPKERVAAKDEKPEDKAKLDKEFADRLKKLEAKLTQEKNFEKWTCLVSSWTIEPLLKKRSELMEEKKDEKTSGQPPARAEANGETK